MTTTFEYLVSSFFEKNGLESPIVKDGIYSLLINEKYQLHFTHQNEEWMVLYAELGEMNPISEQLAKSNIFGEYWYFSRCFSSRKHRGFMVSTTYCDA
ncbi:CesT family type III secretion system chaperone [Vibrio harveyi]|nr:CesT family type III secretion system chaperone [Vibrio harveyi]